jgi:methylated-DNA-[protein]-cysteine S-methyltransferase
MNNTERFWTDALATPLGRFVLMADDEGNLRITEWTDHLPRAHRLLEQQYTQVIKLEERPGLFGLSVALNDYFNGDIDIICSLPVRMGGTEFQRTVWTELRNIQSGHTMSYGSLAEKIGKPKAVRAVGLANGANPIGVVVPCHRVIGSNGSLTGYGGGIERKRWLLAHEGAIGKSLLD